MLHIPPKESYMPLYTILLPLEPYFSLTGYITLYLCRILCYVSHKLLSAFTISLNT